MVFEIPNSFRIAERDAVRCVVFSALTVCDSRNDRRGSLRRAERCERTFLGTDFEMDLETSTVVSLLNRLLLEWREWWREIDVREYVAANAVSLPL
jgi:hypothetical protein